ncbi:MAG: CinA family protein [Sphingopyxis sp.]|nr:CinA family protein [Sphingopyxis sp.]
MMLTDAAQGRAAAVLAANRAAGRTIALAESCTGGLVAAALTAIAGSSDVFTAGFVTYSNAAKAKMLGVDPAIFDQHGAVSSECALAMAAGALANSDANVAVSITGVAGPGGGSRAKPVGLVVFGRALRSNEPHTHFVQRVFFQSADRTAIREAAMLYALGLLYPAADGLVAGDDVKLAVP